MPRPIQNIMVPPAVPPAAAARSHHAAAGSSFKMFDGAPVTKLLLAQVLLLYLMRNVWHLLEYYENNEPTASIVAIIFRLMVCKLTFSAPGPLILGGILLGTFGRRYERELGSLRFIWLCLFCNALVILLELLTVNVMPGKRYDGPYPLLGACLWLYYCYAPRLYPSFFSILGLEASEKSIFYSLFGLVLFREGLQPAILGMMACCLFCRLQLQFPNVMGLASHATLLLQKVQAPPRVLISTAANGVNVLNHHAAAANARPMVRPVVAPPRPVVVEADPAAIEQLVMMGFDQDQVVRTLQATNNNVERAADQLLSQLS
ncbi:hypothetical protein MPSEU_000069700 [Mayamaea pseudoterrestris]|nr:hypothetical protein MPSEU_000069700 [Mayamaea pseudoterrestris]